jgi:hypothetical protein
LQLGLLLSAHSPPKEYDTTALVYKTGRLCSSAPGWVARQACGATPTVRVERRRFSEPSEVAAGAPTTTISANLPHTSKSHLVCALSMDKAATAPPAGGVVVGFGCGWRSAVTSDHTLSSHECKPQLSEINPPPPHTHTDGQGPSQVIMFHARHVARQTPCTGQARCVPGRAGARAACVSPMSAR